MGRYSVAGIVNRCGLDDPGTEPRCRRGFPALPPTLLCTGYRVTFPGLKRPGRGFDHTPHLASRLKKEFCCTSTPPLGLYGLFHGEIDFKAVSLKLRSAKGCQRFLETKMRNGRSVLLAVQNL